MTVCAPARAGAQNRGSIGLPHSQKHRGRGGWTRGKSAALFAASFLMVLAPDSAFACADPTDRWYRDASDVVFDGTARCDAERRSCEVRVGRVLKNSMSLPLGSERLRLDYQNWYADQARSDPDTITITCGVPLFEPAFGSFQGRFYANFNPDTSELVVRTHRVRARDRRLWRESACRSDGGEIVCEENQ